MKNSITQIYPLRLEDHQQVKIMQQFEFKELQTDHVGIRMVVNVDPYSHRNGFVNMYVRKAVSDRFLNAPNTSCRYLGSCYFNSDIYQVYMAIDPVMPKPSRWKTILSWLINLSGITLIALGWVFWTPAIIADPSLWHIVQGILLLVGTWMWVPEIIKDLRK